MFVLLPIYPWVCGLLLHHGGPVRGHALKENCPSPLSQSYQLQIASAKSRTWYSPLLSMLGYGLA